MPPPGLNPSFVPQHSCGLQPALTPGVPLLRSPLPSGALQGGLSWMGFTQRLVPASFGYPKGKPALGT